MVKRNMKRKMKKGKRKKRKNRDKGTLEETDTRYIVVQKPAPKKRNKYVLLHLFVLKSINGGFGEGFKCIFMLSPTAPYTLEVVTQPIVTNIQTQT